MEPISALSVAAAVVQFVDFGKHLLSDACEIYRSPSGETTKMVDASTILKDLAFFTARLSEITGTSAGNEQVISDAEAHLITISKECEEAITHFSDALGQWRTKRPRFLPGNTMEASPVVKHHLNSSTITAYSDQISHSIRRKNATSSDSKRQAVPI